MGETLINLDTAKLADSVKIFGTNLLGGVQLKTDNLFNVNGESLTLKEFVNLENPESNIFYNRPTQDFLQKFLREKHLIDITVITNWVKGERVYYCGLSYVNKEKNHIDVWFSKNDKGSKIEYKTYEEAREVGLFKGLNLI